jgi:hypothetical protein
MLRREHSLKSNTSAQQDEFVPAREERLTQAKETREGDESEHRPAHDVLPDFWPAGLRQ